MFFFKQMIPTVMFHTEHGPLQNVYIRKYTIDVLLGKLDGHWQFILVLGVRDKLLS